MLVDNKGGMKSHLQQTGLQERLHSMQHKAGNISQMSLRYILQDDPEYYHKMKMLVDRPFVFSRPFHKIDLELEWPPDTRPDDMGRSGDQ